MPPSERLLERSFDDTLTDGADRWRVRQRELQRIGQSTQARIVLGESMLMPPHPKRPTDLIIDEGNAGVDILDAGDPFLSPHRWYGDTKCHDGAVLKPGRELQNLDPGPGRHQPKEGGGLKVPASDILDGGFEGG